MSDPCEGKRPGHKLPGGKICKGLLDTIEGKAKSRIARVNQTKHLQEQTWVEDYYEDYDDDEDDDKKKKGKKELPHNPRYGKGSDTVTKEDKDRAARFMKSAGRRRRKKKKTRRNKRSKKKKRRRRRRTRRKRGGFPFSSGTKRALTQCKLMLKTCCPNGDEKVEKLFDEMDEEIGKLQTDEEEIILALETHKDKNFIQTLIQNKKISDNFREALKAITF